MVGDESIGDAVCLTGPLAAVHASWWGNKLAGQVQSICSQGVSFASPFRVCSAKAPVAVYCSRHRTFHHHQLPWQAQAMTSRVESVY